MIPVWFEVTSLIVLTVILIADLLLILKRPHIPSTKESSLWVAFYVALALIFLYPLNKRAVEKNAATLAANREAARAARG